MAILSATSGLVGMTGVTPNLLFINTNDTLATVTTAGYLNKPVHENLISIDGPSTGAGGIMPTSNMAFVNTSDEGPVLMSVSITGVSPNLVYSLVTVPSSGGVFGGNVQAGASGTAGAFLSYPGTAARGHLVIAAANNAGNTVTTITNASQAAARTYTIQDMANATANFCLAPAALVSGNVVKATGTVGGIADAGFAVKANTTAAYAGGGTSNAYAAAGVTATSIVTASILASTNAVSILKVIPGVNTLTVSFSANPGAATTVNYIAVSAAV